MSHFLFRLWQEFLKRYWLGSPSSFWWILKRMSVFRPLNWSSTHVSTRFFCFPAWMRLGSRKPETHTLPKIHAIPCRLVTNCVRQGCEFVASCWSCMCTKHLICSKLLSKTIVEPGDRLAQGDSLTHVQYKIIPRLIYHYKFKWDFNKFGREKCFLRQS